MMLVAARAISQTAGNAPATQKVLTQKAHGQVLDGESKQPLAGVTVILLSNPSINASTDDKGYFTIVNVPVGRQSFGFSMIGFETGTISEAMVISGKEL